jgi:ribonuclease BN (tRNA processing enzyme)
MVTLSLAFVGCASANKTEASSAQSPQEEAQQPPQEKAQEMPQQSAANSTSDQIHVGGEPYPVNPTVVSPKDHVHPSDFTVMTIGTGCPDAIVGRSGPSTMVQYKGKYFLVDVGEGTTQRLVEAGIHIGDISNILFTHMHLDHTDGFQKFFVESWTSGRRETNIVGVPGVEAMHGVFESVFAEDINYRLGKTGTTDGMYEKVNITEIEGKGNLEVDGMSITYVPTIHAVYNLAYRFDADGKSIVVSGDTSYNDNLIELSKDADVLVVDVGRVIDLGYIGPGELKLPPVMKEEVDGDSSKAGGVVKQGPAEIDPATYTPVEVAGLSHGMLEDISIMAQKANVGKLVLTHYPPFNVDVEATEARIHEFYDGEVVFGQDLLEIEP